MRKVSIPEGESNGWKVEKFSVTPEQADWYNLRQQINHVGSLGLKSSRDILPGEYTRLKFHDIVVMSDTPAEQKEHDDAVNKAEGNVLVFGLGLGMYVDNILYKDDVKKVRVVELSRNVITLVAPTLEKRWGTERLSIVPGDAFEYKLGPGEFYDFIWCDIWSSISASNLLEMRRLFARYLPYCVQCDAWAYNQCAAIDEYNRRLPEIMEKENEAVLNLYRLSTEIVQEQPRRAKDGQQLPGVQRDSGDKD